MSCVLGGTPCTKPVTVVDQQTGEKIDTCQKHVTITNILRRVKGEPQYREVKDGTN